MTDNEMITVLRKKERRLYALDKQFISDGLRLILLLPSTAILFIFGAWGYNDGSPIWWGENIEPNVGADFATGLTVIALTITIGFCASLIVHMQRASLTRKVFKKEVEAAAEGHRPVTSMHGFASIDRLISRTMASHNSAIYMSIAALLIMVGVLVVKTNSGNGQRGLLAASSLVAMAVGQHLSTRNKKFHMVEMDGLLSAYEPPLHPSTLNLVFNDLLRTHMDPLLRSRFDDFLLEFESNLRKKVDREFAREKFLMTMYRRNKGSIDKQTAQIELLEILNDEGVHSVMEHEVFSEDLWDSLIDKSEKSCRAFYRLIDRLEQDLSIGKKPEMEDLLFDVDLENIVMKSANLFCFLYNLTDKPRQVVLRVQSPDFRPHDLSLKYSLAPGEKMWWSDSAIPVASKGDDDQLGRMSGLLQDGTVAWQTLLPVRTGEASVAIRLEEPSGDLLVGRQINIQVRSEFRSWLRNTGSVACYFIGGCGLMAATFFQAMALIAIN